MAADDLSPATGPSPTTGSGGRPSLVAQDIHVTYQAYEQRRMALRSLFSARFRRRRYRAIHAVKGVDLEVLPAEVLGVIGPNGSGKSTLLAALAGLLPATQGAIYARSEPTLLGVGSALLPGLSGWENIRLGCFALGMTRKDVDDRIEGIVEFAELSDFITLPMRTYSTGMRARLQFAIATSITPDVLLIDEALAVGDAKFKQRSTERLRDLTSSAAAVVVVTHSMREIRSLATRAVWLEGGCVVADGSAEEVADSYEAHYHGR
jgi:teichoic acid transport system ATP-binding protein